MHGCINDVYKIQLKLDDEDRYGDADADDEDDNIDNDDTGVNNSDKVPGMLQR